MNHHGNRRPENRLYSLCLRPTDGGNDRLVYLKRNYRNSNGKSTSHSIRKLGLLSEFGSKEDIDRLAAESYNQWKAEKGRASVFLSEDDD